MGCLAGVLVLLLGVWRPAALLGVRRALLGVRGPIIMEVRKQQQAGAAVTNKQKRHNVLYKSQLP